MLRFNEIAAAIFRIASSVLFAPTASAVIFSISVTGSTQQSIVLNGPVTAPTVGYFSVTFDRYIPGTFFAEEKAQVTINGNYYDYDLFVGNCNLAGCPPSYGPWTTDNIYGYHLGGGVSTFTISDVDRTLDIQGWAGIRFYSGSGVSDDQVPYTINIELPDGITPVPEPSTWAMMLIGLTLVGSRQFWSRSAQKRLPTIG